MKNPVVAGIAFKTKKVCGRAVHIADLDGIEIGVAYSETPHLQTGASLGWYWDKRGAGTSRTPSNVKEAYGTYFASIEEAVAAVLEA